MSVPFAQPLVRAKKCSGIFTSIRPIPELLLPAFALKGKAGVWKKIPNSLFLHTCCKGSNLLEHLYFTGAWKSSTGLFCALHY